MMSKKKKKSYCDFVEKQQMNIKIIMIFAGVCTKQVYFLRSFENNLYSGASLQ